MNQNNFKIILGIETSCDETAASVVQNTPNGVKVLSNVISSSASLQAKYGGVIPEQAAREQVKTIIPVIHEALIRAFEVRIEKWDLESLTSRSLDFKNSQSNKSHLSLQENLVSQIDAIAVTQGPGLIGSLLVGVETAKVLAQVWSKPLIPVNHLIGHFYGNWVSQPSAVSHQSSDTKQSESSKLKADSSSPTFPCLGLLVSGGHTDLVLMQDHGKFEYLGGTLDDAAGECFDKSARLLGLPYPGGPSIAKAAKSGNPKAFNLPRPMINSDNLDFSFSGLKTAVANLINQKLDVRSGKIDEAVGNLRLDDLSSNLQLQYPASNLQHLTSKIVSDLAASVQEAIVDTLINKTIRAAQSYNIDQIILAGGVAANQRLKEKLQEEISKKLPKTSLHVPAPILCTDNAAMIGTAALFNPQTIDSLNLQASPSLSLLSDNNS